jgi:hypothetical protein
MKEPDGKGSLSHPGVRAWLEWMKLEALPPRSLLFNLGGGTPTSGDPQQIRAWISRVRERLFEPIEDQLVRLLPAERFENWISFETPKTILRRASPAAWKALLDSPTIPLGFNVRFSNGLNGVSLGILSLQALLDIGTIGVELAHDDFPTLGSIDIQRTLVDLMIEGAIAFDAAQGFMTLDRVGNQTAHELLTQQAYGVSMQSSREWVRGYQWGTLLTGSLIDRLGGIKRLEVNAPVHATRTFERLDGSKGIFLQLTPDIRAVSDDQLRSLKHFFAPFLRPRDPEITLQYFGPPIRFVAEEGEIGSKGWAPRSHSAGD